MHPQGGTESHIAKGRNMEAWNPWEELPTQCLEVLPPTYPFFKKPLKHGLVGWALFHEGQVAGLIPGQGTCPGGGFGPQSGHV